MLLGWLQLRHKPLRLLVALSGIAFAVLLIMMQLGFRSALFESAVRFHERFDYDIALFSPDSVFIVRPQPFSIRRLYQSLGFDAVEDVTPVYIFPSVWKNPWDNNRRSINTIGFQPDERLLAMEDFDASRALLRGQDVVLFDSGSRPEFGPVKEAIESGETVVTEINDRQIEVVGLFEMGTSFGIDGTVITSDDNWLRLFPDRSRDEIQLGLIRLHAGADRVAVRNAIADYLPDDVLVMTKQQFVQREKDYWNSATPIGYIFAFGAIMGFVVGAIIVYQILFADVSEHLNEYATLRAIGYRNRFVSGIVLQQAVILAVLGYLPGVAIVYWLYGKAAAATNLPLYITQERAITVFLMTLGMCAISALMAVRKVRRLDPAEVF
ncbi:MAG: FtsX-like permease family protein [Xanthomonadales bacterium]|nr:ABC transporter permease DevC [Gammaproteobacteria bacterium]MBT8053366.1 ABC transporter permease DevC [Gammaproteobacteria bacterium]NND56205.1 FtsX-like permease family protein [Xanthomonadales bacterium]NNK50486.1 FtsX-like permease family protein [Xanthomonadales bacterium]